MIDELNPLPVDVGNLPSITKGLEALEDQLASIKNDHNTDAFDVFLARAKANYIAKSMNMEWKADEGMYRGYLIDPVSNAAYHIGHQKQWRPTDLELRTIAMNNALTPGIIQRRKDQIGACSEYMAKGHELGWRICHINENDPSYQDPPDAERKKAYLRKLFEYPTSVSFLCNTFAGLCSQNIESNLIVDRMPTELMKVGNRVTGLVTHDPTTIRPIVEVVWKYYLSAKKTNSRYDPRLSPMQVLERESEARKDDLGVDLTTCTWVQYVNEKLVAAWGDDDLIVGIGSPQVWIDRRGFGLSRTENCILALHAWLKMWGYNVSNFQNGLNLIKGILTAVGSYTPNSLTDLKDILTAQARGDINAHRLPIVHIPHAKALDLIKFNDSNNDMQYMEYGDLCSTLVCIHYGMDPNEMSLASRAQRYGSSILGGSKEEFLKMTKSEGLNSLLRQLKSHYDNIIHACGDEFRDYRFIWTGLLSSIPEKDRIEIINGKKHLSINEQRKADNQEESHVIIPMMDGSIDMCEVPEKMLPHLISLIQAHNQEKMMFGMQGGDSGGDQIQAFMPDKNQDNQQGEDIQKSLKTIRITIDKNGSAEKKIVKDPERKFIDPYTWRKS